VIALQGSQLSMRNHCCLILIQLFCEIAKAMALSKPLNNAEYTTYEYVTVITCRRDILVFMGIFKLFTHLENCGCYDILSPST